MTTGSGGESRPFRRVNNREQFLSDPIDRRAQRRIHGLRVDVECDVRVRVSHEFRDDLPRHALIVGPRRVCPPERE